MRIDDWPMQGRAIFSEDKVYRYSLTRTFLDNPLRGPNGSDVIFVMLNPSTADDKVADPTVRRCMRFANDRQYRRLTVLNLFALRATDPKRLYEAADPVGPENNARILMEITLARLTAEPMVICAWGNHGDYRYRGQAVLQLLEKDGIQPYALRINPGTGQPGHPLYLPANLEPIPLNSDRSLAVLRA